MKTRLRTHRDLDGVSCAVLAKRAFENVEIAYCDYDDVDKIIMKDILESDQWDELYITDISVNPTTAAALDNLEGKKIVLLDHHGTALWLNCFPWAKVETMLPDGSGKESGTNLFYQHLVNNGTLIREDAMAAYVENVRQYDTWEWATKYNNAPIPRRLANLLSIYGMYRFVNRFAMDTDIIFTSEEAFALNIEEGRREKYIKDASKKAIIRTLSVDGIDYKTGVIFAEMNTSELAHAYLQANTDVDIAIIVNMYYKSVSLRTERPDINLGDIAINFGGGGHPAAAGFDFGDKTNTIFDEVLHLLCGGAIHG